MLRPYFALFPREQVLCLKFDAIIQNPGDLAARLHRFIGVTPRAEDATGLDVVNPSEKRGQEMPVEALDRLRQRYAAPLRELATLAGPGVAGGGERWNPVPGRNPTALPLRPLSKRRAVPPPTKGAIPKTSLAGAAAAPRGLCFEA